MSLLYKDFIDQGLECESCPLMREGLCPGGYTSTPSGTPIEPPCCSFDDDTDMEAAADSILGYQLEMAEREEKACEQKQKRQDAAKKAAETRRAVKWYCWDELYALKQAKNDLRVFQNALDFARTFAEAFNVTNKMFGYAERAKEKPETAAERDRLEKAVKEAQKKYDAKKAEFYQKRKDAKK